MLRILSFYFPRAKFTTCIQNFRPSKEIGQLGINDLTFDMKTALQLAADKGFGRIVRLLLRNGATTSLVDWNGKLYVCPDYDGVQVNEKLCVFFFKFCIFF